MIRVHCLMAGVTDCAVGYAAAIRVATIELVKQGEETAGNPPTPATGESLLWGRAQLKNGIPIALSG
jgi:hypothetical protein